MVRRLCPEELRKRYKEATRFTTGVVFGQGDCLLGQQVLEECVRRREARKANAERIEGNKKAKLRKLKAEVTKIRNQMEDPTFTLLNDHLKVLVRWKARKDDGKMPTKKDELRKRWDAVKGRPSPHVSPCNRDDELEDDVDGEC